MAPLFSIKGNLSKFPKYRDVIANEGLVNSKCVELGAGWSDAEICSVIRALGFEGRLAVNPDYAAAFGAFFEKFWGLKNDANEHLLVERLTSLKMPITAENLEAVVSGGYGTEIQKQLTANQVWRKAQQEIGEAEQAAKAEAQRQRDEFLRKKEAAEQQALETDRMINEIVGYMLDARDTVKREYTLEYKNKVAGLRALPFAELTARYDVVIAGRQERKMPVEAVRAAVKTDAQAQRKTIFSTEAPEVVLVNPNTNQPFTGRKELVNFFNKLSRQATWEFFHFPEGRVKPGVETAVSKILKGMVE